MADPFQPDGLAVEGPRPMARQVRTDHDVAVALGIGREQPVEGGANFGQQVGRHPVFGHDQAISTVGLDLRLAQRD